MVRTWTLDTLIQSQSETLVRLGEQYMMRQLRNIHV